MRTALGDHPRRGARASTVNGGAGMAAVVHSSLSSGRLAPGSRSAHAPSRSGRESPKTCLDPAGSPVSLARRALPASPVPRATHFSVNYPGVMFQQFGWAHWSLWHDGPGPFGTSTSSRSLRPKHCCWDGGGSSRRSRRFAAGDVGAPAAILPAGFAIRPGPRLQAIPADGRACPMMRRQSPTQRPISGLRGRRR